MRTLTLLAAAAALLLTAGVADAGDRRGNNGTNTNANSNVDVNTGAFVDARDQSNNIGSSYKDLDVAVSTATAPHLWATEDTCMGSSSVGVQAMMFGFSTGTTWRDEDCVRRKDSRELYNMGNTMPQLRIAAVARMCQKSANIAAMHAAGLACPGEGTAAATTRIHGEQFFGIHNDRVVEGSAPQATPAAVPVAEPRG